MEGETLTTYTLSDDDLRQAVAEFIKRQKGHSIGVQTVKITVAAGSPYYSPNDAGTPASVKVTVEVKG